MKLIVPISKNNPVKSVPKTVKLFKETSSYCKVMKMILMASDISKNQIAKENNIENRLVNQFNFDIIGIIYVKGLTQFRINSEF